MRCVLIIVIGSCYIKVRLLEFNKKRKKFNDTQYA